MTEVKKRILIVDDSSFTRAILKRIINSTGFCKVIGEAKNGEEALNAYKKIKPDLVTMDLILPGKNGLEVIKEILQIDSSAVIIIISALDKDAIGTRKPKEVKALISKPFKDEVIIRVLEGVLLNK